MSAEQAKMKQRLAALLFAKSYLEGDFVLSSGKRSNYYFDCRQTSLHPEGAFLIGSLFFAMIMVDKVQAVGGMTLGADPLVTSVSLAAYARQVHLPGLLVRKEAKKHGAGRTVEGLANVAPGSTVAVLEDALSTGGSALRACQYLEDAGLRVSGVYCILNRQEGGEEAVATAGLPLRALYTRAELLALAGA